LSAHRHFVTNKHSHSTNTVTSTKLANGSFITCQVNRKLSRCLLDTGSRHNLASHKFALSHRLEIKPFSPGQGPKLFAANSSCLDIIGSAVIEPRIKGLVFPTDVLVCNNLSDDFLLGTEFISCYNVLLDYKNHIVTLDDLVTVPLINSDSKQRVVRTTKSVYIPPKSEAIVPVLVHKRFAGQQVLIEPMPGRQFEKFGVARSLNTPISNDSVCRVLNYSESSLVLYKGQAVAFVAECVKNENILPLAVNRMSSEVIDRPPTDAKTPTAKPEPSHDELDAFLSKHKFEISDKAPVDEKYKLALLLLEFEDVFASEVSEMKSYTGQPFEVKLTSNKASYRRQYKVPHTDALEIERQIQNMHQANVLERATGNDSQRFNSPIFLVTKSDNTKRAVLDLRGINKLIEPVVVNLPPINDIVADLAATKPTILSTIDILSFFWQIPLQPGISRSITTMTSPLTGERWQYTRAPFGLSVSGGFSQIALLNVIGPLIASRLIYVYCDDIVVPTSNHDYASHLKTLRSLFTDLRRGGLTINIRKSKFLFEHCEFLSHHIDASGYHMIPKYTSDVIRKFATPTNARAVSRWACFSSFYRRSIRGYAQKIGPIRALLKKDTPFVWTDECERIFREVNESIISPPILHPIDPSLPIYLLCDASKHGTSYSLHQKHGKIFYPCLFGGQSLNQQQAKWPVHEQEIFSVVQCLHHHYSILSNMRIICVTDNSCLQNWSTMHLGSNRLKRWYHLFTQFQLECIHVKGSANSMDAPSRMFEELDEKERFQFTAKRTDDADDFVLTITADKPTHGPTFVSNAESVEFDTDAMFDEYTVTPLSESTLPLFNDFYRPPVETDNTVHAIQTRSAARQSTAATSAATAHPGSAVDLTSPDAEAATAINQTYPTLPISTKQTIAEADTHGIDTDLLPFTDHPPPDDEIEPNDADNLPDTNSQTDVLTFDPEISISVSDYETDDEFKYIMAYKLHDELTGDDKRDRKTLLTADSFFVLNNLLYRVTDTRNKKKQRVKPVLTRLCVPRKFTFDLVLSFHNILNHAAYDSLLQALRQRYYFSSLNELAYEIPRTCDLCGRIKPSHIHKPPLHPHPVKGFNEAWAVDHFHLTRQTVPSGYRYILVMVEMSTRYCELALCHSTSALETSRHILEKIVANHGVPHSLHFDRSTSNINTLNKCLAQLLSIKLCPSASRAKISNGLAEIYVKQAKKAIKFHCEKDENIELAIPAILIGLRASTCKPTASSPFYLCRGYEMPLAMPGCDATAPFSPPNTLKSSERAFVENFAKNLKEIQTRVQTNSAESKAAMKTAYDQRYRVQPQPYCIGNKVWLEQHVKAHSASVLTHRPYSGPYYLTEIVQPPDGSIGPAYRLVHSLTGKPHKALVPAYRLKPCEDVQPLLEKFKPQAAKPVSSDPPVGSIPPSSVVMTSPPPTMQPGFEPAIRIVKQRKAGQSVQYLVLFLNRELHWVDKNDVTDDLERHWILKRDAKRKRRRRKKS